MNEDLQFFWGMGILFGLVMLFSKPPIGWKYFHGIIFLSYFVYAYWDMNDSYSIKHGGGYTGIIVAAFTTSHIIIYLIGKVIFGFIRRQNQKTEGLRALYQSENEKESGKQKENENESENESEN
jgi:hypothetical protein